MSDTDEIVDLSAEFQRAVTYRYALTPGLFRDLWEKAGRPRQVSVPLEIAIELRTLFAPSDFRPLDNDTFQLPFLTLSVQR